MLQNEIGGNSIFDWGISILIVVGAFFIAKLFSLVLKKVMGGLIKRTANHFDDIIYESIRSPILFAIMLIGIWIAIHRLVYPDSFVLVVDSAYRILIVLNITWLVARLASNLIEEYWTKQKHTQRILPVLKRSLVVVVWIVGLVMALSNVGVNIGALLGTLGIGGIAFALAAQDTVKNIFGAFTLLTDKPFTIGDLVKIDSFEGTIIDIGARSTKMLDYDKRIITFPNYKVADAYIINISVEPKRRVVMKINLAYDTTHEMMNEAMRLLKEIPSKIKYVSRNDLTVMFSDFSDSALVITFIYFIEKEGDIGKITSDVNMEILRSFNEASLNFVRPMQIQVESVQDSQNRGTSSKQDN